MGYSCVSTSGVNRVPVSLIFRGNKMSIKLPDEIKSYTKDELIEHCRNYQDGIKESNGTIGDICFLGKMIDFIEKTLK